ncbi:hypothetical protein ACPOLB_02045 [Rubrivivax sp. RP6-9]|uniref:hypothetical protein n=1 Tax=Rubrivivax sp. RP6-9 TaxID=3415750 RepID=UPI003CC5C2C9
MSLVLIGLALSAASQAGWALGWARAQQSAVLGAPLDFTAALRLDPGDVVAPDCVRAEVHIGERRVGPGDLRTQVDSSDPAALVMRVATLVTVDEPVVAVTLSIGCPARMSRRFVLLADPPLWTPPAAAAANPVALVALAGASAPAAAPAPAPASAPAAPAPAAPAPAPRSSPAAVAPAAATPPARPAAARPAPRPATRATPRPAPVPRLRLEPAEPAQPPAAAVASAVDDALQAVAQAASAARAAASAASAAEQRVAALEATLVQLRGDVQVQRDLVTTLRAQLTDTERTSRWLMPLLLALVAMAGLAGWLYWKLRLAQAERQAVWRRAAAEADAARPPVATSQLPLVTSELMAPPTVPPRAPGTLPTPAPMPRGRAMAPLVPAAPLGPVEALPPESVVERTQVLPPQATAVDSGAPRDVTIEELLDLEQQAEFFIVLGQEDAAVDLLVDHLRNTGGGSPLPYLKLLEIYRRRGARDAYERTRARFNHRFNAYAPDWDADLQHGRSLEDYAGVLPRLQQVWPRPLDAMAELEALLFRKSRGDLFELPAYREVLFLYSLARDLLDREAAVSGDVDLLLPLADGGEFSSTSPHPYFGDERDSVFDSQGLRGSDRPTAPVDLDLTQPEDPPAIAPAAPRR